MAKRLTLKRIRELRNCIEETEAFMKAQLPITAIKHIREGFKPELNMSLFDAHKLIRHPDKWAAFKAEWM